jgi:hypothetical protein
MRTLLEIANSPWDQVQTCERLADGVFWVTTAGHGGLMVDAATATEELSAPARQHGMKWGRFICYEEDCACSIPFFERPDWFAALKRRELTKTDTASVLKSVKDWEWRYYEARTRQILQPGESYQKDAFTFEQDHAADLIVVSATSGNSWEPPLPAGMVKVVAVKGGRNKHGGYTGELEFLVPADEYKARGPHGFIVDPARHQEIIKAPAAAVIEQAQGARIYYPVAIA